ncbi:MAG: bluetail domain-containing putative surface protein [Cyanobacteria bacterium J06638_38]
MLGNNNGIEGDDLALKDGTVLTAPVNFDDFYTDFADGWRIDQEESLFDYADGEDTSTFTETNFFENDNVIVGLDSNDIIAGGPGNDSIIGKGGADRLTGDSGNDTFIYKSLEHSVLSGLDTITDLEIGTDKINGVYAVNASGVAQLAAVEMLDEASIQAVLTEAEFVAKGAATFTYDNQTFLALNDQVAGYSAADDALIEITGFAGSLADLAIL